ncbi:hypothetical protein NE852_23505 [Rhizobium sp. Pop5]|uniref:hypothetical protein n=1 Tax=Rhizobium sp. Pop5 TaxID=1223565 RepID=UPI0002837312|nr:hypothetical protein [Rhizobium sp. Pop5]EJZ22136.1 hypothetical protein RCCGEPOP_06336 [Rhizobium sp. Pop5]UVD56974.1 hypothetical protein NE852_23505 [Rhizobium sp. Pop5]
MAGQSKTMDVKEAVRIAKAYASDIFAEDGMSNFGLEEVDYDADAGEWLITVGFSRPWSSSRNALSALTGEASQKRLYRVVRMNADGEVLSVKRRATDE